MPSSPDALVLVEAAYHQHYETSPARASVSFVGVEPIEILRYEQEGAGPASMVSNYLSLGMSRYPMTAASASLVDVRTAPRAELLFSVLGRPDDVWRRLAVLAAAPAVESAVYQLGARVDLGEAWCAGSRCTGAVVVAAPLLPIPVPDMAEVVLLKLLPALPAELAWARVHGSEALLSRWRAAKTELRDLYREPVDLS
ncbi:MAG: suppressor of fused domain protein [Jatrophihabitantaceae bacterium]